MLHPLGERLGVRVNSERAFRLLLDIAAREGWTYDQSDEPVEIMYSLRLAEPSKRPGRRDYHLLYLAAGRVARTLDTDELLSSFAGSVWAIAAMASQQRILLRGQAVRWQGRLLLLAGHEDRALDRLLATFVQAGAEIVERQHLQLDNEGHLVLADGSHEAFDGLLLGPVPDGPGTNEPGATNPEVGHPRPDAVPVRLTPGGTVLRLLTCAISYPQRCLPVLGGLAQRRAGWELPSDVGPAGARALCEHLWPLEPS